MQMNWPNLNTASCPHAPNFTCITTLLYMCLGKASRFDQKILMKLYYNAANCFDNKSTTDSRESAKHSGRSPTDELIAQGKVMVVIH